MLVLILFAGTAAAQIRGATGPLLTADHVEITYAPVAPVWGTAAAPSPLYPLSADGQTGSTALLYFLDFDWSVNPTVGELQAPNLPALTETEQAAIDVSPDWMKPALFRKFFALNKDLAGTLAAMIVNPEDPLYTDELAFTVAYTPDNDLLSMKDPVALLTENVRLIYEDAAELSYVQIVELGTVGQGDYGTTLSYRVMVDGVVQDFEIPKEVYYWNVVAPRLSDEAPDFIKPSTGARAMPGDGGVFWRSYLPHDLTGADSYGTPMYFQGVNADDLQNLTPSAPGHLRDMAIHNLEVVYDGATHDVIFAEYAFGSGEVYATTLRLDAAYTANGCKLLENLLNQGNGDVLLKDGAQIALIHDSPCPEFQDALTALGRWADVTELTSAQIAAYTPDDWTTFNSTFQKVVVPTNQPADLWAVLSGDTVKAALEAYVSNYGVLEFHLVPPVDAKGYEDLTFPTGFGYTAAATDAITVYGRPKLFDMLAGKDILWDGQRHDGISGDRPLWDDPDALQALGNWVGKNMLDNIEERQHVTGGSPNRSVQPVRIAFDHYGNCGELEDLIGAAMRTALIAGLEVTDMNEDHVWNEFYHDNQWLYFQNDWSNGATRIATPGGGQDVDYGGGKDISFILAWWADASVTSVTDRYSKTITLAFHVTDSNGGPVPDALVEIWSEGWQTQNLMTGFWMRTDADGRASVLVGDNRNYDMRILSSIGDYPTQPATGQHLLQVVTAAAAVDGATFNVEHQFTQPLVQVTESAPDPNPNQSFALHVVLNAYHRFSNLVNYYSPGASAATEVDRALLDVFLVDQDNLSAARGNKPFTAAFARLGVADLDETIFPPTDATWHLLVKNHSAKYSDHLMDISVTTEGDPWQSDDDAVDDDTTADDDSTADDDTSHHGGGSGDNSGDNGGCGC
jgi:hypothetical protein